MQRIIPFLCLLTFSFSFSSFAQGYVDKPPRYLKSKDAKIGLVIELGRLGKDDDAYRLARDYITAKLAEQDVTISEFEYLDHRRDEDGMMAIMSMADDMSIKGTNVLILVNVSGHPKGNELSLSDEDMMKFTWVNVNIFINEGAIPSTGNYNVQEYLLIQEENLVECMTKISKNIAEMPDDYFLKEGGVPIFFDDYEIHEFFPYEELKKDTLIVAAQLIALQFSSAAKYEKLLEDYPFPYKVLSQEEFSENRSKYRFLLIPRTKIFKKEIRYVDKETNFTKRTVNYVDPDYFYVIQDNTTGNQYLGETGDKSSSQHREALKKFVKRFNKQMK